MTRAPLKPGEHTITTTKPTRQANGSYFGRFSLRQMDGRTVRIKVTAPTVGEWKTKALKAAKEALRAAGTEGTWTPSSLMSHYITEVSVPAVQNSTLRGRSKDRYVHLLHVLAAHFKGYTVHDAVRFRRLETVLKDIASEHGSESARQARNVLSKTVIGQLIRDEVVTGNPLLGMSIDLGNEKKTGKSSGGIALTREQYEAVLSYLLGIVPEDTPGPRRGPYTLADRISMRRTVVEMTLLQATTGLRISEARNLLWSDINDDGTTLTVTVRPEVSKTKKGRTIPVLDSRVTKRLRERQASHGSNALVFGAPARPDNLWDSSNAQKAVKRLMCEVADACSTPVLHDVSSHVWRATLNTHAMQRGIPAELRAAYFGHDASVNRESYTDTRDTTPLVEALGN